MRASSHKGRRTAIGRVVTRRRLAEAGAPNAEAPEIVAPDISAPNIPAFCRIGFVEVRAGHSRAPDGSPELATPPRQTRQRRHPDRERHQRSMYCQL